MNIDTPPVEFALPVLREMLEKARVDFKIVGGLAVVHHGYIRTTEDIDIILDPSAQSRIDALFAEYGFIRESTTRLRHQSSGVRVDLLIAGQPMPRPGAPAYPSPSHLDASPKDAAVVSLPSLVTLKLYARRQQDLADVVALLKQVDDSGFLAIEQSVPAALRHDLDKLRLDALEELRWEQP